MNPTKILYIDGQGVSVTRFTLKVKNQSFPVKTLSYRPVMVTPRRLPAMIAFIVGLVLLTSGYVKAISPAHLIGFEERVLLPAAAIYVGLLIMGLSLLAAFMTRERYALQITTSEGVRNIVVSRKKSYIMKIVHRLHYAASLQHHHEKAAQEREAEIQQVA
jgi:hypothetical protein